MGLAGLASSTLLTVAWTMTSELLASWSREPARTVVALAHSVASVAAVNATVRTRCREGMYQGLG